MYGSTYRLATCASAVVEPYRVLSSTPRRLSVGVKSRWDERTVLLSALLKPHYKPPRVIGF